MARFIARWHLERVGRLRILSPGFSLSALPRLRLVYPGSKNKAASHPAALATRTPRPRVILFILATEPSHIRLFAISASKPPQVGDIRTLPGGWRASTYNYNTTPIAMRQAVLRE